MCKYRENIGKYCANIAKIFNKYSFISYLWSKILIIESKIVFPIVKDYTHWATWLNPMLDLKITFLKSYLSGSRCQHSLGGENHFLFWRSSMKMYHTPYCSVVPCMLFSILKYLVGFQDGAVKFEIKENWHILVGYARYTSYIPFH